MSSAVLLCSSRSAEILEVEGEKRTLSIDGKVDVRNLAVDVEDLLDMNGRDVLSELADTDRVGRSWRDGSGAARERKAALALARNSEGDKAYGEREMLRLGEAERGMAVSSRDELVEGGRGTKESRRRLWAAVQSALRDQRISQGSCRLSQRLRVGRLMYFDRGMMRRRRGQARGRRTRWED